MWKCNYKHITWIILQCFINYCGYVASVEMVIIADELERVWMEAVMAYSLGYNINP
jgi:hypothetical protein